MTYFIFAKIGQNSMLYVVGFQNTTFTVISALTVHLKSNKIFYVGKDKLLMEVSSEIT